MRWLKRRTAPGPELPLLPDEPVSRTFGFERGKPVDRWYIERFLAEHSADVRGRVLEVAESTYTGWYGGDDVTTSDVLYAADGNPDATVVGDLTTGAGIPEAAYDCFICTQTLQVIYDIRAAVAGTRRLLAPGGVLLGDRSPGSARSAVRTIATGATGGASRPARRSGSSPTSTARSTSQVRQHGNVHAAAAFLYGLAAEDLDLSALESTDPDFHLVMTVRAVHAPSER